MSDTFNLLSFFVGNLFRRSVIRRCLSYIINSSAYHLEKDKIRKEVIVLAELLETAEYERCLIYPVKFTHLFREENAIIIEVDSLEELRMIAEGFHKPLLYDEHYYLVIFDKDVHYRTKKPEI